MSRDLRSRRVWDLLEQFPRAALYRIGGAAQTPVRHSTKKHELLEVLSALPEVMLERALIEGLTWRDLQALCARIGRSRQGTKGDLAARIVAAMDELAPRSRWRPFAKARAFARRLALTSQKEWFAFARGHLPAKGALPADIPRSPQQVYAKTGWTNWGDFLGTRNQAAHLRTFRSFAEARAFARRLALTSQKEWFAFARGHLPAKGTLPEDVPAAPHRVYAKNGWTTWGDFLGTGRVPPSKYQPRSYEDACAFVRALGIRTESEWRMYCRGQLDGHAPRPRDIPASVDRVYRGRGWVSWGHFLGTDSVATSKRTYRSFAAARAYVRAQGLRSQEAWHAWNTAGHRPADIPAAPAQIYRGKGWVSWGDFLGTGNVHPARIRRRSFAAARAFVRRLGLRSGGDYRRAWHDGRMPKDIPLAIDRHPEWTGWADFLGPSYTGSTTIRVTPTPRRSFAAARTLVRPLGLRTRAEYRQAKREGRIPKDIPARIEEHPEWKGWEDFLGPSYTGRTVRKTKTPKRKRGRRG